MKYIHSTAHPAQLPMKQRRCAGVLTKRSRGILSQRAQRTRSDEICGFVSGRKSKSTLSCFTVASRYPSWRQASIPCPSRTSTRKRRRRLTSLVRTETSGSGCPSNLARRSQGTVRSQGRGRIGHLRRYRWPPRRPRRKPTETRQVLVEETQLRRPRLRRCCLHAVE